MLYRDEWKDEVRGSGEWRGAQSMMMIIVIMMAMINDQ